MSTINHDELLSVRLFIASITQSQDNKIMRFVCSPFENREKDLLGRRNVCVCNAMGRITRDRGRSHVQQ